MTDSDTPARLPGQSSWTRGAPVASAASAELAAGKGFLFSDQGDTALRGFEDPVRLYEVRWQGSD